MCFYSIPSFDTPKISKNAFKIYKVLEVSNSQSRTYENFDSFKERLVSPYIETKYQLDKLYSDNQSDLDNGFYHIVNKAFHSYRTFSNALKNAGYWHHRHIVIIQGEIPKDSLYMLNAEECVSNKIILKDFLWTSVILRSEPDTLVYLDQYSTKGRLTVLKEYLKSL